jgi:hypothetical protein
LRRGFQWIVLRGAAMTAQMLFSRHPGDLMKWLRSMAQRSRRLAFPLPWVTFDATRAIEEHLPVHARVFEFGAGNSTVYWAGRGAQVWSVEGDREWFDLLQHHVNAKGLGSVKLQYAADPAAYTGAISGLGVESFDMVVVDGAFRRDCVLAAISHVKPGGMLVVDNTDWHWFREDPIKGVPDDWRREIFPGFAPMIGHRSETTVYFRPSASVR